MAELKETDSSMKESEEESDIELMGFECFKYVNDYTPFKFKEKLIMKKPKKYFAFTCCENLIENISQKNTNSINEEKTNKKESENKNNKIKPKNEINSYNSYKNFYNPANGYLGISTDDMREVDENDSGEEESEDVEDEEDFQDFEDELGINKFSIRPDSCVKTAVVNIIETYNKIKPNFYTIVVKEEEENIILTEPSEPKDNNGKDNENLDLIVCKNDKIKNDKINYIIIDLLGTGISGQTFKVLCLNDNKYYALKIIKNNNIWTKLSHYEYLIMKKLNEIDKKDEHHIIRSYDCFKYNNHLCIVNELMQKTLLEILKANRSKGLSLTSIRFISKQILKAVDFIHNSDFVHTDLKPENILLSIENENNENNNNTIKDKMSQNTDLINNKVLIKIADFGSACLKEQLIRKTYIQSMYYRAPEVIIGLPLNEKVDVWSIGCILIELYLSTPIMPGTCSYDQLYKINSLIGHCPQYLINVCKKRDKYFINVNDKEAQAPYYRIKSPKDYYKEFPKDKPKDFYVIPENLQNLDDLINVKRDTIKSKNSRLKSLNNSSLSINSSNIKDDLPAFIHLLKGMLQIDPNKRWNCKQCLKHPFITREKLDKLILFENEINQFMSNSFNYNNKSHVQNNYRTMNKSFNINNLGNQLNYSFGNFNNNNFMKFFPNNQRNSNPNDQNYIYPQKDKNYPAQNNNINYNNYNNNNINNQKLNSSFSYNMYQKNFFQNQGIPQYFIAPNYYPMYNNINNNNNYYPYDNNSYIKPQNNSFFGLPPQNLNSSYNNNQNQNYNLQNFQNMKNFKKNKQFNKNEFYFNKNKNNILNTLEENKEENNNDNNNNHNIYK